MKNVHKSKVNKKNTVVTVAGMKLKFYSKPNFNGTSADQVIKAIKKHSKQ